MNKNLFSIFLLFCSSIYASEQKMMRSNSQPDFHSERFETCLDFSIEDNFSLPDDIKALIKEEAALIQELNKKNLRTDRRVCDSSGTREIISWEHVLQRKQRTLSPISFASEVNDLKINLQKRITDYKNKLKNYEEGFVDVTESQVNFAQRKQEQQEIHERWTAKQQEEFDKLSLAEKITFVASNWIPDFVREELNSLIEQAAQVSAQVPQAVAAQCTVKNMKFFAGASLSALGSGAHYAFRGIQYAQKALEDKKE